MPRPWLRLWDECFAPPRPLDIWDILGGNTESLGTEAATAPITREDDRDGQSSWLFRLTFGPVSGPGLTPPQAPRPSPDTDPLLPDAAAMIMAAASPSPDIDAALLVEAKKEPVHDRNYSKRKGYDQKFLGITVPLPSVTNPSVVSKTDSGDHVLRYHHFSIVQHKDRRLALFTASNVDASPARKKPEAGKDYTRTALNGFGPNDREQWFLDPRIPALHQLPDEFYNKDRQAFDKGHIVRREDVAWGRTYKEVQFGNGDSFHCTNCSPQVKHFNQSGAKGIWGELENFILAQADDEKLSLFAGPLFTDDDPEFKGVDDEDDIVVKIPQSYWKIVIARVKGAKSLQTFAFLLEQDLTRVQWEAAFGAEFTVTPTWRQKMIRLTDLAAKLPDLTLPKVVLEADQFDQPAGNTVQEQISLAQRG